MKNEKDLFQMYKTDFGHYPLNDEEYIKWLEEKVLEPMNEVDEEPLSTFDLQMKHVKNIRPWKPEIAEKKLAR